MLTLELELVSSHGETHADGFVPGHMTISGLRLPVSSKGKQPDQAMMIFPSLIELLDGIRFWLSENHISACVFSAVDSSFEFTLGKEEMDRVGLTYRKEMLGTVSKAELLQAVWAGVNSFVARYGHYLTSSDPLFQDWQKALNAFKDMLAQS